jgi:hypothetical protein
MGLFCAVAVAGTGCIAENFDSLAYVVAVGSGATAISHLAEVEAVAVGYEPFAIAPDKGTAISIGSDPSAMAGQDGYLVFVDTASKGGPFVKVVKANFVETGIRPDVPIGAKPEGTNPYSRVKEILSVTRH